MENQKEELIIEAILTLYEELMGKIEDGPGSHVDALTQISNRHPASKELREAIAGLNESVGAIRLVIKYLVFDLEATCRERDVLRTILEDQND